MARDTIAVALAGGYNGCELWGVHQYRDPKRPCNRYLEGVEGLSANEHDGTARMFYLNAERSGAFHLEANKAPVRWMVLRVK